MNSAINSIPDKEMQKILDGKIRVICKYEKDLLTLSITVQGRNSYGHIIVFLFIVFILFNLL